MELPSDFHAQRFTDWNHTVRGLVEIFDLARMMGVENDLEYYLNHDRDGELTELLARIGNDCATLAQLLRTRSRAEDGDLRHFLARKPHQEAPPVNGNGHR